MSTHAIKQYQSEVEKIIHFGGTNGHSSGEKLFQKFTFYSSRQNRTGPPSPATPKKFQNKIDLLESILEKLSKQAKQRALDEVKILKTHQKNADI